MLRRPRLVSLLVALAVVLAASAAASPSSEIRSKRQQAQAAQAEVARLGMQLESAVNRYDTNRAELAVVRGQIGENERAMRVVRANIAASQRMLGRQLVVAYRAGDPDVTAALLTATSVEQLVSRIDVIRRASGQLTRLITSLGRSRQELATRQGRLERDRRQANALVRRARAARDEIVAGLARQRALVRGLESEISQLRSEEASRQRRLASAARRRLQGARAAAERAARSTPDPGIGGSAASTGAGSSGPIVAPPSDGSIGARVAAAAMSWLGTPYSWGGGSAGGPTRGIDQGAGTVGFDCSGLTVYAYAQVGIVLGHYTGSQWDAGTRISRISDLAVGDLVFFGSDLGHMGLYIGAGQFIHAPHTGDVVKISDLAGGYYASAFVGGVRPY